MTQSRKKEFQALRATQVLVKVMDKHGLNMVQGGLQQVKNPTFKDMTRIALEQLTEAGHSEDAALLKQLIEGEWWPLRYQPLALRKMNESEFAKDAVVVPRDELDKLIAVEAEKEGP